MVRGPRDSFGGSGTDRIDATNRLVGFYGLVVLQGNTQLLETLRRRFVSGPIDWAKEWGLPKK
jgi:hypothetical protein